EGHASLASIRLYHDWDWRGAEASVARALELEPSNSVVLRVSGTLAVNQGRLEEGIGFHRRALEQDPLSLADYHNLGCALYAATRFEESEAMHRKALEIAPQGITTRANLSLALLAQGRSEEALAEAMLEAEELWPLWALAIVHHALGHGTESEAALRELIEKHSSDSACQIAEAHAARGDTDGAFEWLERARDQHDPGL